MFSRVKIDTDLSPILEINHKLRPAQSCISTTIFKSNTKFPSSLCHENTTIHQNWWRPEELPIAQIEDELNMDIKTVSSVLLPPGNVIPMHTDTFDKMRKEFPLRDDYVRAVIYASSYSPGQLTQIRWEKQWHTHTFWAPGDGYIWNDKVPHVTVNGSLQDLYMVNFSGFMKK